MLVAIAMDVLNRLLICMDLRRFLTPLPCRPIRYRASLYVDDIVLFVAPLVADLTALKTALEIFATASGLYTNLDKCVATPIHSSQEQIDLVSETMTCAVADFPCRYLGVPLSIYKPRRSDE